MGDENQTLPEKVSVSDSVIGSGSDNGSSCGSDNYNYNGNESFECVITFIISSLFHPSISSLHFFLSAEFLWQEGHTAHATAEDAVSTSVEILDMYASVCEVSTVLVLFVHLSYPIDN